MIVATFYARGAIDFSESEVKVTRYTDRKLQRAGFNNGVDIELKHGDAQSMVIALSETMVKQIVDLYNTKEGT